MVLKAITEEVVPSQSSSSPVGVSTTDWLGGLETALPYSLKNSCAFHRTHMGPLCVWHCLSSFSILVF